MCNEPLLATDAGAEHIVQMRADALCDRCGHIVLRALGPAQVDIEIGPQATLESAGSPLPSDLMELVSRYTRARNAAAN